MPKLHERPIMYIKNAFIWALYYLKNNFTLNDALKDVLKKGGDTTANAAIVGGLLGAACGLQNIDKEKIDAVLEVTQESDNEDEESKT
jgi:ADP-ribosylglycohydrolase